MLAPVSVRVAEASGKSDMAQGTLVRTFVSTKRPRSSIAEKGYRRPLGRACSPGSIAPHRDLVFALVQHPFADQISHQPRGARRGA